MPTSLNASFTSSSLKGLMTASIFFIFYLLCMYLWEPFYDGCFDKLEFFRIPDFLVIFKVPDIKYIHDLVHLSTNHGHSDVKAAAVQGICDAEQQAFKIIGQHLDDGEKAGCIVVYADLVGFRPPARGNG